MYPSNQNPTQRIHYEYSTSTEDAYFRRDRYNLAHDALTRAVLLVGSTLTTLLVLRFVFALLDANTANSIVSFGNFTASSFMSWYVTPSPPAAVRL